MFRSSLLVRFLAITLLIAAGSVLTGIRPALADPLPIVGGTVSAVGNPVSGTGVNVYPPGTTTGAVASTTTAGDGSYSISVTAGTWDFVFTPPAPYTAVTKSNIVVSGDQTLNVVLVEAGVGVLSGRLVDSAGAPVSHVNIELYNATLGDYQVTTADDGTFRLAARNGAYQLFMNNPGYGNRTTVPYYWYVYSNPNTFLVNGDINLGDVALPATAHATFTVLDPANQPVDGASVRPTGDRLDVLPGFANVFGIPITGGYQYWPGAGTGPTGVTSPAAYWPSQPKTLTVTPPTSGSLVATTTPALNWVTSFDLVVAYQQNGSTTVLSGVADSYSTTESTPLTVAAPGVLGNDLAPTGSHPQASAENDPAHGMLALNSDGSFTFTPTVGFVGTDQFSYRVSALGLQTPPILVTITVSPPPLPTIAAISPAHGPTTGGTSVTITGTHLLGATAVAFGSIPASSFTVVSDTAITATSPPSAAGVVDVHVTTPAGTSITANPDQFTYDAQPPTVTSISPASGPAAGGTTVTINGTNFTPASTVAFGTVQAGQVTFISGTSLTVAAPPGSGVVDVTVTTADGTSAITIAGQFVYLNGADLETTLTTSQNPVALGDAFTETVAITNHGPGTATQIASTVTFTGATATILGVSISQGSCTTSGPTVTCSIGTLQAGTSAIANITVEPAATGTITIGTNTSAQETDPVPANTNATTNVTVDNAHGCTVIGLTNNDTINGTSGNDVICALSGDDNIYGGGGDDVIYGGSGNDTLDGGPGNDTIFAGNGGSILIGGNGNDTLTGGSGNDTIYGGNGNDTINGGDGNDTISGGNSSDTINGGNGNDTVDGGSGNDTCTNTENPTSCTG